MRKRGLKYKFRAEAFTKADKVNAGQATIGEGNLSTGGRMDKEVIEKGGQLLAVNDEGGKTRTADVMWVCGERETFAALHLTFGGGASGVEGSLGGAIPVLLSYVGENWTNEKRAMGRGGRKVMVVGVNRRDAAV